MLRYLLAFLFVGLVLAENGLNAWLRYASLPPEQLSGATFPSQIVALNSTSFSPVFTAGIEVQKGIQGITGKSLNVVHSNSKSSSALVVGTLAAYEKAFGSVSGVTKLEADGYWLSINGGSVQILGQNERGALYGAFAYLSRLGQGDFSKVSQASNPQAPVRWVNQWDNLDGSIERGYGGSSVFWWNGTVVNDLTRAGEYARILASVGINAVVVNNVNADQNLLTAQNIAGIGRVADVLRPWGVQLGVSLNFASPQVTVTTYLGSIKPLNMFAAHRKSEYLRPS